MSVEIWKSFFDWAAVVLVGLTFIAGAGALIAGKVISNRQSDLIASKDRQAAQDSKAKDLQIATLTDRATKAEASIAVAGKNAAEANAKTEGFKAQIAKANESAAQAQAQVAGAMAEAAKANLELERIKLPRSLNPVQQALIAKALARFAGTNFAFVVFGDPESLSLLNDIDGALRQAGWHRVSAPPVFSSDLAFSTNGGSVPQINDVGLKMFFPADAPELEQVELALAGAISAEGIPCEPRYSDKMKGYEPRMILIWVGQKKL